VCAGNEETQKVEVYNLNRGLQSCIRPLVFNELHLSVAVVPYPRILRSSTLSIAACETHHVPAPPRGPAFEI